MKQSAKHSSHLRFFTVLHRDGSSSIVRGYDVRPHAFASVPFKVDACIVHRSINGKPSWRVTDKATGGWIAFDGSPDKAIYSAALKLATKGEQAYREGLAEAHAKREQYARTYQPVLRSAAA